MIDDPTITPSAQAEYAALEAAWARRCQRTESEPFIRAPLPLLFVITLLETVVETTARSGNLLNDTLKSCSIYIARLKVDDATGSDLGTHDIYELERRITLARELHRRVEAMRAP